MLNLVVHMVTTGLQNFNVSSQLYNRLYIYIGSRMCGITRSYNLWTKSVARVT